MHEYLKDRDPSDPMKLMHALMDLQQAQPAMYWAVADGRVTVTIPVTQEQEEFLRAGRQMFEPIDGE